MPPRPQLGYGHVEFREGLAEAMPVDGGWADVVISNGVINLCADKQAVFAEIFRVLRPGGVLQFADIANGQPVPTRGDARHRPMDRLNSRRAAPCGLAADARRLRVRQRQIGDPLTRSAERPARKTPAHSTCTATPSQPAESERADRQNKENEMAVDDKVVIGQTHGLDDPEAVLIGYLHGRRSTTKGKQVVMWLTKDGINVATYGFRRTSTYPARHRARPAQGVHGAGGRFFACPVCVKTRGLEDAEWVETAEVKGAPSVYEFAEGGALTFNY